MFLAASAAFLLLAKGISVAYLLGFVTVFLE